MDRSPDPKTATLSSKLVGCVVEQAEVEKVG
jgi:hypothetical protein